MQFARQFRIPALICGLAVFLCDLISRPFATMSICDDGPYIAMAQSLARTGHISYNGWATAMLGWQLYLGAVFVKLFGSSFTSVRMSTTLLAMALAFLLQRTLVRAGITERNSMIATLALVISPLYLLLSATFMSDIQGLFAIVICIYGCLRALQANSDRATIAWLCFAVVTNAICGTSRQIAWLGVLVIVPSALWLLRRRRQVFIAGAALVIAGGLFILGCMIWLRQQPYTIPEHLLVASYPFAQMFSELARFFLDLPFLLLPIAALFVPQLFNRDRRSIATVSAVLLAYAALTLKHRHLQFLEPTYGDWLNAHGQVLETGLNGTPPLFFSTIVRILLTIFALGGLLGLAVSFLHRQSRQITPVSSEEISWRQLHWLLLPYTFIYSLFLIPRAASLGVSDRYLFGLIVVALLYAVRYFQDRIKPDIPIISLLLIVAMAVIGVAITHNTFAFYRARVQLATELRAAGIPDTSVDNGWEYNIGIELQQAAYINHFGIVVPKNAYVPTPPPLNVPCPMFFYDATPHIHPIYAVSFQPGKCYGPAPFAPVSYPRWLARGPGTLYVVRYVAEAQP